MQPVSPDDQVESTRPAAAKRDLNVILVLDQTCDFIIEDHSVVGSAAANKSRDRSVRRSVT